jgi:hypothetical protein
VLTSVLSDAEQVEALLYHNCALTGAGSVYY